MTGSGFDYEECAPNIGIDDIGS